MVEAYIAFGSNMGDREANINKAIAILKEKVKVIKASSLYETKPMYMEEQGWFLNCAAKVETDLAPKELLGFLKGIEKTWVESQLREMGQESLIWTFYFTEIKLLTRRICRCLTLKWRKERLFLFL